VTNRIELEQGELETLREALAYSKERVLHAQGTPDSTRVETLGKLERVASKLRMARRPDRAE
jgi:hypothetical protein